MTGFKWELSIKREILITSYMILRLYKYYVAYIYFMKGLYRKRNKENTSNSVVLGIAIVILNIHSVLVILDVISPFELGILKFWTPSGIPKSGYGYISGLILALLFLTLFRLIERQIPKTIRIGMVKKIIQTNSKRKLVKLYVFISVLFFITSIAILIHSIVPEGGF